MNKPRVFADFHNADTRGRLRLNCTGRIEDLALQKIWLRDAQELTLYSEDLEVDGIVRYSTEENVWVAVINWDEIREQENYLIQESKLNR
ncbi:hypothetical protein RIVM261_019210 [Rivularia sp. IAM M-261]|nr:hypothetical protein RIVM261_019210 [Rivularia sp. IAM M-261]